MFARLLVFGFGQALLALAAARLLAGAFDDWIVAGVTASNGALATVAAALLGTSVVGAWLRQREHVQAEQLGQSYLRAARARMFERLGALPPRVLQAQSRGGHLLRFVGDLTALRQWLSLGLARLSVAGVTIAGILTTLAVINPVTGAGIALVLGVGGIMLARGGRRLPAAVREARRRRARVAANISEKLATMAVVQAFDQLGRERRRLRRQGRELAAAMIARARLIGWLRGTGDGIGGAIVATALVLGTLEASAGRASPGTVAAIVSLAGMLAASLRDLSRTQEYWQSYRVAHQRISQFMTEPLAQADTPRQTLLPGPGRVELRGACVDGSLAPVDLTAGAGEVIAVVGPNGAGKSTLLALLAQLAVPSAGQVLIDDQDLAMCDPASVRRAVGIVSPDLPLLRGSVLRNLRYRWPAASDEALREVCEACDIDGVLATLRDGWQTRVREGGANLSLGQRQRIALARALLGQPRVLLLDEADANLDRFSAGLIDRVIESFPGTVILVTHRRERLVRADRIWHLDGGRLVETGTGDELLRSDSATRRLFRAPELVA